MRKLLVVVLVLVPFTVLALGKAVVPPVHKWADTSTMSRSGDVPAVPTNAQFQVVRIDTMTSYIRFLFEHKQAEILPDGTDNWFYFAYNDNWSHIRTVVFNEDDMDDPSQWIVADIAEWTGEGTLRYYCPSAYHDGTAWYPQVAWNSAYPVANFYQIDEGGLGVGLWTPEIDVLGPTYDYYLPLIDTGPDNVVYLEGQAFDTFNGAHIFKSFDGWTGALVAPEVVVGVDTVWNGQGYENGQMMYADGMIVIGAGAFRTSAYTTDPLLTVYKTSTDGGLTWSDDVWLDQAVVPDMPGGMPGIDGHQYNSFFDMLIDLDGDLHFMMAIVDSGYWDNTSYHYGFYDVHQDNGTWTASQITDGVYTVDGVTWDPRSLLGGDTWMHAPSLALHPDGYLCAAWNDAGYFDLSDSTLWFDIFYSWSADGGNTWHNPVKISDVGSGRVDAYFPRLIPTTTDDYAYVLSMYDWGDSPLDMYVVPWDVTGADDPAVSRPSLASLSTRPNPFKDDVAVSLSLASAGMVEASVYNARGEVVETLARGTMPAGAHSLVWNAGDAPAGVYFCRVKAGEERLSARMVLVR